MKTYNSKLRNFTLTAYYYNHMYCLKTKEPNGIITVGMYPTKELANNFFIILKKKYPDLVLNK